jgi:SPP1 gp7 family putative phage head morphogenesis protein
MASKKKHTQDSVPKPPKPGTKSVIDTSIRNKIYVERVAAGISEDIRAKATSIALHDINWFSKDKEEQVNELFSAMGDLIPQLAALADYQSEFTAKFLEAITRNVEIKSLKAGKAFEEAMTAPMEATGTLVDTFVEGWAQSEVDAVGQMIVEGYRNGWTSSEIEQAIRGTKEANYADGVVARIGRNVDAVVRTVVQHVSQTAMTSTWADNADIIDYVRCVATLDGNTTPECRSLDGQEFPLGEAPQFPLHINCRTVTVPVVKDKYAFLDEGATRSSLDGYVPASQTYYEWLDEQSVAFQDDVLGPTRGQLFRDGGLSPEKFARLNVGRNYKPLTLDEMRAREPHAFERAGL